MCGQWRVIMSYARLPVFLMGLALFCGLASSGHTECLPPDLELRGAAFFPESKLYREIYGTLPSLQLEASYPLIDNVRIWSNITGIYKTGHSIPLHDRTSILVLPWSLGLNYMCCCRYDVHMAFGAGASFTTIRIRDHSPYVKPITQRYEVGGLLKFKITKSFNCVDVSFFTDYFLVGVQVGKSDSCVSRHSADVGGLFIGLGIGKTF